MSIPDPKNLLNLLPTFHFLLFQKPFWTSAIWSLQYTFLIFTICSHRHHYFDFHLQKDSSTFLPLWQAKDTSQGTCHNPKHWTSTLKYKVPLLPQVAVNCSHPLHKLRVLGGLFFISHIHINHIQSCVHFGADISTLFCLKLSGKIIGGLFHVLELKHWACSD